MNRFRSDQKWKDRWGSGFIVLAILLLVGAWWVGDRLANPGTAASTTKPDATAAVQPGSTTTAKGDLGMPATAHADLIGYPKPLSLFLVQAGAFNNAGNAAAQADKLIQKGLPAVISQSGAHHKVFIGAYRTKEAAVKVKAQAEAATGLALYTAQIDLPSAPTALPAATATGVAAADFQDAVAALSGYLHESANFFEDQALGRAGQEDRAMAYAQQLSALTTKLKAQASDPTVGRLLSIAGKVNTASTQQAGVAAAAGHNPDATKAAMQKYLSVLGEFRAWADTASAS